MLCVRVWVCVNPFLFAVVEPGNAVDGAVVTRHILTTSVQQHEKLLVHWNMVDKLPFYLINFAVLVAGSISMVASVVKAL